MTFSEFLIFFIERLFFIFKTDVDTVLEPFDGYKKQQQKISFKSFYHMTSRLGVK